MNTVVLRGRLSAPPRPRTLPSGRLIAALDLATDATTGERTSVPVVVMDPPPALLGFAVGSELVVVGEVRRRFFRSGGATVSRTEVVAAAVVPAGRTRQVRTALQRAARSIALPA